MITTLQKKMLAYPDDLWGCFSVGGKGGSKTWGAGMVMARYMNQYPGSRAGHVRQTWPSLVPQFAEYEKLFNTLGQQYNLNRNDGVFTFPNRSTLTLSQLPDRAYHDERHRGSSYQIITIDEYASWPTLEIPNLMLSNLRGTTPVRALFLANPGPASAQLQTQVLRPAQQYPMGMPFRLKYMADQLCAVLHSDISQNEALNPQAYLAAIRASAPSEAAYLKDARGDFSVGEFNLFRLYPGHDSPWPRFDPYELQARGWKFRCSYDHGSRAPWCCSWQARATQTVLGPDGKRYGAGAVVAFWESTNCDPESGWTRTVGEQSAAVPDIADTLKEHAEVLGFKRCPPIFADDQITQYHGTNTIIEDFKRQGLTIRGANKGRVRDSVRMVTTMLRRAVPAFEDTGPLTKTLFRDGTVPVSDTRDGLYISKGDAPYTWFALESAVSDPRDPDALSSKFFAKHAFDALVYGLVQQNSKGATSEILRI